MSSKYWLLSNKKIIVAYKMRYRLARSGGVNSIWIWEYTSDFFGGGGLTRHMEGGSDSGELHITMEVRG